MVKKLMVTKSRRWFQTVNK